MPVFDLTDVTCLDQQEPFTDEIYLVITEKGGKATRYDLGRDFEDDETVSPDVYFAYDGPITVTLWEDDPVGDDKIGSFTLDTSDRNGRIVLAGSGGEYLLRYDILA